MSKITRFYVLTSIIILFVSTVAIGSMNSQARLDYQDFYIFVSANGLAAIGVGLSKWRDL
jgi:hypothetical protein